MKRLLLLAAALTAATAISAKDYKVTSPDGQIEVKVSTYPELRWSASRAGEPLLDESRIGMTFAGEVPLGAAPAVRSARTKAIDERSTAEVPTKFRELHDRCNELEIAFRGDWALRMRVYDNGVAYRFETSRKGDAVVVDETAEFNFAADNDTYWTRERNPDFISHCEAFFERKRLSELERSVYAFLPVYFATPQGTRMVVTETDLEDYPCMFLFGGEGSKLHAEFPPVVLESRLKEGSDRNEEFLRKADYIAATKGTRTYPWRVVTIDGSDRELLENYLPYQLAAPAIEGDASWVRPGKIAWDWWNGLNVYGVDFQAGVNTATYKYFIDFAAKYGIEYILLDEGWSVSTLNIREPRKEVDLQEIIRYGNEKGVGVVLWTLWNPMKKDLEGIRSGASRASRSTSCSAPTRRWSISTSRSPGRPSTAGCWSITTVRSSPRVCSANTPTSCRSRAFTVWRTTSARRTSPRGMTACFPSRAWSPARWTTRPAPR